MENRKCTKCLIEKPLDQFNKRTNGIQHWCRECSHIASRSHYKANKKDYHTRIRSNQREIARYVRDIKDTSKCQSCGETHPATLQFHHRDPETKLFSICSVSQIGIGLVKLKEEIEKCDILCANCHFKLHYRASSV